MQRKFIYFINPISGTKNKTSLLKLIETKTTTEQIPFQVLETKADSNYDFLPEQITREKITDVIVCGGDGTVNQVASALLKSKVNIGILPMGSGNGLALAAGIPRNTEKALEIIFKGKAEAIDAFYINGFFSCMLCGLGFDAQVAHDFAKQKKRGLGTYAKETIKNFVSATAYPFTIAINEKKITEEAFFISIANSNQFGNNVTIAPRASISDGLLDIVIVKKMSKLRMLYSLVKQIKLGRITNTEKKFHGEDILYFQAKKLSIQNPGNAPLHIDGDPADSSREFKINIIEKAFRLLQP
jgi:YegS/Rv2252/BmrU family lipid kinase